MNSCRCKICASTHKELTVCELQLLSFMPDWYIAITVQFLRLAYLVKMSFVDSHIGFELTLERCWPLKVCMTTQNFRVNSWRKLWLKIVTCSTNATSFTMSADAFFLRHWRYKRIQIGPTPHQMFGSQSHSRVRLQNVRQVGQCDKTAFCQGSNRKQLQHHVCTVMRSREPSQARHRPRFRTVAPVFLEHAHQPRACASIVCKHAFAGKDLPLVWRLRTFSLLHPCHGSPLGVCLGLCEAVRLARNLCHGLVLVVGNVVHQRPCLGAILAWFRASVCQTVPIAQQPTKP